MVSDKRLIQQISESVRRRMTPGEFYRSGREAGNITAEWHEKGCAERKGKHQLRQAGVCLLCVAYEQHEHRRSTDRTTR